MVAYCFKCAICGERAQNTLRMPPSCHGLMQRDYRAEAVGIGSGVRTQGRPATNREMAELFLPQAKDFKGRGDPDGTKGLREWADTHDPKPGNNNPTYPEGIPRRSY